MYFGPEEINQLVESIWGAVLGWEVRRVPGLELPAGNVGFLTGCVQITGAWEGAVQLVCAEPLARQAAAVMFATEEPELTAELVHDALGELTNMTGGNLKALLPETCYLCLPAVVAGTDYALRVLDSQALVRAAFQSRGHPFVVAVLEHTVPENRKARSSDRGSSVLSKVESQ